MSTYILYAPNGKPVDRILENAQGGLLFDSPRSDPGGGDPYDMDYGLLELFDPDGDDSVRDADGERLFLDDENVAWPESCLRLIPADDPPPPKVEWEHKPRPADGPFFRRTGDKVLAREIQDYFSRLRRQFQEIQNSCPGMDFTHYIDAFSVQAGEPTGHE